MMRLIGAGALALSLSAAAEDLTIPAGESRLLDADTEVGTLTVGEGATLWLNGHTLTVNTALAGPGRVCAVPAGYTLLECVKATGTQYIDTGIKPINEVRIEADVAYTGPTGSSVWQPLIGASNSGNNNIYGVWIWPNSGSKWYVAYNGVDYNTGVAVNNSRCLINAGWKYTSSGKATVDFKIDGASKLNTTVSKALATVNQTMMLPARNRNGAVAEISKCDIYSFKIYNPQTTLVRNYVPMKRNSDEAIGLFDEVSREFFPSTTATPFEAGDEVAIAEGGELHINPPSNATIQNTTLSIAGATKVVVTGGDDNSRYVSSKNQSYFGGTVVKRGGIRTSTWETLNAFGASGSVVETALCGDGTSKGGYVVLSDGTGQNASLYNNNLVLAGEGSGNGAIYVANGQNSGDAKNYFLKTLSLSTNATIKVAGSKTDGFGFRSQQPTEIYLGGHTLTLAGTARICANNATVCDEGRIVVTLSSYGFKPQTAFSATNATFEVPAGGRVDFSAAGVVCSNLVVAGQALNRNNGYTALHRFEQKPGIAAIYAPVVTLGDASAENPAATLAIGEFTTANPFPADYTTFVPGSAITVDLGDMEFDVGDRVVSWSDGHAPSAGVTFVPAGNGWTAEGRAIKLVVHSTGDAQGLYVATTLSPAYARWDLEDEGWKFYTASGNDYPGEWTDGVTGDMQVRFGSAAEYEAIAAAGVSPASYLLDGNITVPAGEGTYAFSSFSFDFADNVEIDANGRKIALPQAMVSGTKPFTVTSTVAGGEIIVDVPAGTRLRNTSMSLAGAVALRKTGAGTFVSALAQTYEGGTFVDAGTAQPPDAQSGSDTTYSHDSFKAFGTGGIHVASGARFNLRGNYAYRTNIHLDGGTLLNDCVNMTSTNRGGSGVGLLSADSSVFVTNSIVFGDIGSANAGNLGGHELAIHLPNVNSENCYLRQNLTNGTIRTVLGGGRILVVNDNLDLAGTTLDLGTPVNIASGKAVNVQNYTATYDDIYMQGGGRINVYGTFKPAGSKGKFYTCTLQDGATLDLSGRTAAFNTRCTLYGGSGWLAEATMSFAAPAEGEDSIVVKVKVGTLERAKEIALSEDDDGRYIVKWGAGEPQNVTFEFADGEPAASHGFELKGDSTGLMVAAKRGFTIRIAENRDVTIPGEWVAKNYADFGTVEESAIATWLGGTGANGLPRWQSWLLGLEPADARSVVLCVPGRVTEGEFAIGANVDVQADSGAEVKAYLDTSADGEAWNEKVAEQALPNGGTVSFNQSLASDQQRGFYRIRLAVQ